MKVGARILFRNNSQVGILQIIAYFEKKRNEVSLGIKVHRKDWDFTKERTISNNNINTIINTCINNITKTIEYNIINSIPINLRDILLKHTNLDNIIPTYNNINDSIPEKNIEIGECAHLVDTCTKRTFVYYNIASNKVESITVCNEWYKLKFKEYCIKNKLLLTNNSFINTYHIFLKELLFSDLFFIHTTFDIVKYKEPLITNKALTNKKVIIQLCNSPKLYYSFNFFDFIILILDKICINKTINLVLKDTLYKELEELKINLQGVSKYKDIHSWLCKLKKHNIYEDEYIADVNDFLITLLQSQLNSKKWKD